jgi:hypothetical protein
MALTPSPGIIVPTTTLALKAAGTRARAASFDVIFDPNSQDVQINLNNLPPDQAFDHIGAVYIDSTFNDTPLFVQFPDSGAVFNVPANSGQWILAVTAGRVFNIHCPVAGAAQLSHVDVVNFIVQPTGVQSVTIAGSVTAIISGVVSTAPAPVSPVDKSVAAIPATTATVLLPANLARKYVLFQMPTTSDGWISWTGAPAPNAAGSFYLQYAEKYQSTGPIVTNGLQVYLNIGPALMPVIEG